MPLAIMSPAVVPAKRITTQPNALSMDLYNEYDEKHTPARTRNPCQTLSRSFQDCADCTDSPSQCHNGCHKSRLHRLLIPAILLLISITAVISLSCLYDSSILGIFGPDDGILGLGKRALTNGTNSGGSTFVNNKLYLIIIFVGLLVVIILAIMLSAWCCKGAFQNPLCCPCYLCACCGGLACLECIGCGLCAAGIEEA